MTATGASSPKRGSQSSSTGNRPRCAWSHGSNVASSQAACLKPGTRVPAAAITATHAASSAAAGRRSDPGTSGINSWYADRQGDEPPGPEAADMLRHLAADGARYAGPQQLELGARSGSHRPS